MLLLEDKRFYTYIYLDPRKPGNYNYQIKNEILHFDYEPFYVGKGRGNRIYDHLREARNANIHNHKVHKIRKIWKEGYDPLILKVKDILTSLEALMFEEYLGYAIKLIEDGGTLTNARYPEGLSNGTGKASLETRKHQSKVRIERGVAKGKNNGMYHKGYLLKGSKNGNYKGGPKPKEYKFPKFDEIDFSFLQELCNKNLTLMETLSLYNKNKKTKYTKYYLQTAIKKGKVRASFPKIRKSKEKQKLTIYESPKLIKDIITYYFNNVEFKEMCILCKISNTCLVSFLKKVGIYYHHKQRPKFIIKYKDKIDDIIFNTINKNYITYNIFSTLDDKTFLNLFFEGFSYNYMKTMFGYSTLQLDTLFAKYSFPKLNKGKKFRVSFLINNYQRFLQSYPYEGIERINSEKSGDKNSQFRSERIKYHDDCILRDKIKKECLDFIKQYKLCIELPKNNKGSKWWEIYKNDLYKETKVS